MRKPFVAGNWKMNKSAENAQSLIGEMLPGLMAVTQVERVLCPPFTSLQTAAKMLLGSGIGLGAQNMHYEESGAYTGEISPSMVKEFCHYVIIGHSERRAYFGETDETVNRKVQAALAHGLIPILCVGETLVENQAGQTAQVVGRQIQEGLKGINAILGEAVVIAYEPVWAIGTGLAASGEGANAVVADIIRSGLASVFNLQTAQNVRVLYGGSVTSSNAAEFFTQQEIDGALVGGASLKVNDFLRIVEAAGS
jgi:triosephosphate isomerase